MLENFFNKNNFDSVIHTAWITNPLTMRNSELNKNWLQVSKNILNCHLKNKKEKIFTVLVQVMNIIDKKIKKINV